MSFNSPFDSSNKQGDSARPAQPVQAVLPNPHMVQPSSQQTSAANPSASGFDYSSVPAYGETHQAPDTGKHSTLSIVAFILSIVIPIVGLILSVVAWRQSAETGERRGLAKAGIFVGSILTALNIILLFVSIGIVRATTLSGVTVGI